MKECEKEKCPYGLDYKECKHQLHLADSHADYIYNAIVWEDKFYCLKKAERKKKDESHN